MTDSQVMQPPPLAPHTLRIIPLGGHGDVGRNMSLFEIDGRLLAIDCGVLFPEIDHPGVDLILPALDILTDRLDDIDGVVLTHGHEDHIGALPYLLKMRGDIPVFGSELTLGLLRAKLREHRLQNPELNVVKEGETRQIGPFDVEFFAVNHSIPDGLAVLLRTEAGSVLHTGDFKLDQVPLDGRITDLRGFARASEAGVDLLMVDSTNAESRGMTPSEREVEPALERVFSQAEHKLVVACFASHVHRVQQVLDLAQAYGRKVAYVGRSMLRNMSVARDFGHLRVPAELIIDINDIDKYADDEVVIVSTGSQGEPLSALSRMAQNEHPVIDLKPGDTVLLASSLIPGNENAVSRVINGLARVGATIVHKGNALVHVSGHACASEILYVYNIVKPKNAMPVHGEVRHLIANAKLAVQTGIPAERCLVTEDGNVVDLKDGVARIVGKIDASYIFVDGMSVGDVSESELTDRRILGDEGFISAIAVVNTRTREVVTGPDLHARGFFDDDSVFDPIREPLKAALQQSLHDGIVDPQQLQQVMRRTLGRWVNAAHRRRPMIIPVVIAT